MEHLRPPHPGRDPDRLGTAHGGNPATPPGSPRFNAGVSEARNSLFIGKIAEQAGATPKTIRYYEAIGLLPQPQRGDNRHRFSLEEIVDLLQLQFVKKAQGLGLPLSEIKEIVDLHRTGHTPCVHVRTLLKRKIADLDQRLEDLIALRTKLKALLVGAGEQAKPGRIKAIICPHIEEAVPLGPKPRW